jgi:hypothetical protein
MVNKAHHLLRLRSVTPQINNAPPESLQHPINKKNKAMIEEGKFTCSLLFWIREVH